MGYEISIQRKEGETKISEEEWKAYVDSDPEFESIDEYSANLGDGQVLTISTPNAGLWKSEKGPVPFTFSESYGWITVKNPEDWVIWKMVEIAEHLQAVVMGEEGEIYDETYEEFEATYGGGEVADEENPENGLTNSIILKNKPWWKFWT